jgi:hypothetical protein
MTTHDEQGAEITVYSWPALWLYWPMYAALGRVHQQRPDLRFRIRPHSGPLTTDEQILRQFTDDLRVGKRSLALCQPPRTSLIHYVRKVPFVLRMPHWLLASAQLLKRKGWPPSYFYSPEDAQKIVIGATIRAYPAHSTSGDYVRNTVLQILNDKDLIKEITDPRLIPKLAHTLNPEHDGFNVESLGDDLVATFEPWHYRLSDAVCLMEFAGPMRDITALLVPKALGVPLFPKTGDIRRRGNSAESGKVYRSGQRVSDDVYRVVLRHLSDILGSLYETQGDIDQIQQLLNTWQPLVRSVFEGAYPKDIRNDDFIISNVFHQKIAKFLAVYIARSCYFPFRAVFASVGAEIERFFGLSLEKGRKKAKHEFLRHVQLHLGNHLLWEDLSFQQRLCALHDWSPKAEDADHDNLYSQLAHWVPPPTSDHSFDAYLSRFLVRTDLDSERVPLKLLHNERDLVRCNGGEPTSLRHQTCEQRQGSGLEQCFQCRLGGRLHTILEAGRQLLQKSLVDRYGDTGTSVLVAPYDDVLTLFHWKDIEPMFTIFSGELRKPDWTEHPIKIKATIRKHESCSFRNGMLLAIFWQGDTSPGTGRGNGNAHKRLMNWYLSHRARSQSPLLVSLWTRAGNIHSVVDGSEWKTTSDPVANSEWAVVLSDTIQESEGYSFAYFAIFDPHQLSTSEVAV